MAKSTIIQPQEGFQEAFVRSNVDFAVGGGSLGGGKDLSINELILTPNGWVKNGDLQIGMMISTPFGKPSVVRKIFDFNDKDVFLLTTSDGRKIECGREHLWAIRTKKQIFKYNQHHDKSRNLTVITTEGLIDRLKNGDKSYIPIPDAQEFPEKEYIIPPYALGVMIGDGCLTPSTWCNYNAVIISNTEEDVIQRVYDLIGGTRIYKQVNQTGRTIFTPNAISYREYCKRIGLNTHSYNKFIPQEYLFGSIEQRKQLLFGLMDTDGSISDKGSYSFSTTSERLKDDFVHLCRSLGYIARVHIDKRAEKYTSGVCYDIGISTPECIVSSKKHIEKYNKWLNSEHCYIREYKHVYVESIEWLRKDKTRCIYLDDPLHLYIAGDFVTTHNTFAAVLSVAEPSLDGRFRGLFLRNNLGDSKAAGGVLDTFREAYGSGIEVVESGEPRVTFPSGAKIDVTHVADQTRSKILQRFKGRQYDFIYFDEGTGFTFDCFSAIYTRNRGTASWTGKVRMTTNPDRRHWLRTFLDWYIGVDGFIREDREGVVRYFYMAGETVDDVVWGDTKAEVYQKCKADIDRKLAKVNGKKGTATYESMIKSFTFYLGRMSENKAMIQNNDDYVGSVAVMGGRNSQQLLEGNWNVSPEEDENATITQTSANSVFTNDEQRNGDRWITCDLADTGTDNFLAICWDGFHIVDILIKEKTTPRQNAEALHIFAKEHDVADSHIVYDAIRGTYINDYIPDAQQFVSYRTSMGLYGRGYSNLKSECYARLIEAINRGNLSCSEDVATRVYKHQKLESNITIQAEFLEEASVVRFRELPSGKKQLYSKKEMNLYLGKGRSMDLLDPCAMRMMPVLEYPYGEELVSTSVEASKSDDDDEVVNEFNLLDETNW